MITIREAQDDNLDELLRLQHQFGHQVVTQYDAKAIAVFNMILQEENYHLLLGFEEDGKMVTALIAVVIHNLTHGLRPFMLIENVVTHAEFRKRGYATQMLNAARTIARGKNCYKIMLMTGSKEKSTLEFYRKAGYNAEDKTAFIQWLF